MFEDVLRPNLKWTADFQLFEAALHGNFSIFLSALYLSENKIVRHHYVDNSKLALSDCLAHFQIGNIQ